MTFAGLLFALGKRIFVAIIPELEGGRCNRLAINQASFALNRGHDLHATATQSCGHWIPL